MFLISIFFAFLCGLSLRWASWTPQCSLAHFLKFSVSSGPSQSTGTLLVPLFSLQYVEHPKLFDLEFATVWIMLMVHSVVRPGVFFSFCFPQINP